MQVGPLIPGTPYHFSDGSGIVITFRTKISRPQENKSQQNKGVPPGIKGLKMSISSFFYNISKIYD